jgi:hypothetical protein
MNHRGIEYSITQSTTPGVWNWRFSIGDKVVTGKDTGPYKRGNVGPNPAP